MGSSDDAHPANEHQDAPDGALLRLRQRYHEAWRYPMSDPEAALTEARKATEMVCDTLYTALRAANPDKRELKPPTDRKATLDYNQGVE